MKEIITLQFGESANYVGTHYWNMQQWQNMDDGCGDANSNLSMDVFYSEDDQGCVGQRGRRRFTPRVLIFDKVGNFGSLSQSKAAPGTATSDNNDANDLAQQWDGETEVYRQTPHVPPPLVSDSAVGDEPAEIQYWSDFNQVEYSRAKSLTSVSGVEFGNSLGEMHTFQEGSDVFEGENRRDEMLEGKFRVLAEACDQVQGFQVLADAFGGFAGFSAGFVEKVREEHPKSSIMLYNVATDTRACGMNSAQTIDAAVGLATNLENVSATVNMYVPSALRKLGPVGVQVEESSRYQTSAFMALNVSQWTQCLLTGTRRLDEMVNQVTQQQYFKVAETLISPELQISDTNDDRFGSVAGLLEERFVASSDAVVRDLASMAGQLVVDRGTKLSRLVSERYSGTAYADLGQTVALPRSFPRQMFQKERIGVSGLLCTTAETGGYVQRLHGAMQVERSRHIKDYEREWIREVRGVLDSVIDRYATIG
ncbi:mtDNA inheritance, partitioning of the mitochondrial organelle [Coemansia aciculifera]|uniref:MtDNA inheritance, partitioning of the mitochondrial organelle n=1 Tax=Coemansia aciculifera TaxID=417176 RepID=A0ACC1M4X2_9FUNG|nr:mtDNA inheritance, partitioning of the mitochondrial organelle [Coemansia aciculifera]